MKKKILATTFLSTLLLVGSNPLLSNATELSSEKEVPVEIQEGKVGISFDDGTTSKVDFQLSDFDVNSGVRKQTKPLKAVATVSNTKSENVRVNIFAELDNYSIGLEVKSSSTAFGDNGFEVQRMSSKQIEKDFDVTLDADTYVWSNNGNNSANIILKAQEVPNPW